MHRAALDPTRGRFAYSPVSVNFLTEVAKCVFAVALLMYYANQPGPEGRGLHSFTVELDVSPSVWDRGAPTGYLGGVYEVSEGVRGCAGCAFVSETAQVKLRSGRV
jgi:hypothetical protein